MKFFFDTEFIENPGTIKLISIGIVSDDNREYYAISKEYNYHEADDWVKENVIAPMFEEAKLQLMDENLSIDTFHQFVGKSHKQIAAEVLEFVNIEKYGEPEFWGYYSDYDWCVFCWLFGRMIDLPSGFPMYCRDIKQCMDERNSVKLPDPAGEHNALIDARWTKAQYEYTMSGISKLLTPRKES